LAATSTHNAPNQRNDRSAASAVTGPSNSPVSQSESGQTVQGKLCIFDDTQLGDAGPAVLEVLITKRCQTKWEWRVCDRQGATIMNGFGSTRRAAKYRGYRALFHLLAFGWDR
jgi:hypothetical protein